MERGSSGCGLQGGGEGGAMSPGWGWGAGVLQSQMRKGIRKVGANAGRPVHHSFGTNWLVFSLLGKFDQKLLWE